MIKKYDLGHAKKIGELNTSYEYAFNYLFRKKKALFSNENNNNSSSLIAEVLLTSFINEKES
jgi:hypothetical protein